MPVLEPSASTGASIATSTGTSLGRYELVRRLATSRMTEVYLARDRGAQLTKRVVVKRLLPHLVRNSQLVDAFLSEARAAAELEHSNVVRVDHIANDAGGCFYAMEYVRGVDLRKLMKVLESHQYTMSLGCSAAIVAELCAALACVHERTGRNGGPLVHRDLAPSNVLLSYTGAIKLADFGRTVRPERDRDRTTIRKQIDLFEGTSGYMSPEQCLGGPIDGRSDIYSLGVILYELTTGTRLHDPRENDFQILERTVRGWITPPSRHRADYPEELQAIVMRALERDPGQRYQAVRDMGRDLEAFLGEVRPVAASAAVAELVALAAPDAPWRDELAEAPTLPLRPPMLRRLTEQLQVRLQSRWLRAPWSYAALVCAASAGIVIALATGPRADEAAGTRAPAPIPVLAPAAAAAAAAAAATAPSTPGTGTNASLPAVLAPTAPTAHAATAKPAPPAASAAPRVPKSAASPPRRKLATKQKSVRPGKHEQAPRNTRSGGIQRR